MNEQRYLEFHQSLFDAIIECGCVLKEYSEEPRAFSKFYAIFTKGSGEFQIVRDRSTYLLYSEGMPEKQGIDKAFKDKGAFQNAVVAWLST